MKQISVSEFKAVCLGLLEKVRQTGEPIEILKNGGGDNFGRDHNPYGFSIWMADGGIRGGKVIGATDEIRVARRSGSGACA